MSYISLVEFSLCFEKLGNCQWLAQFLGHWVFTNTAMRKLRIWSGAWVPAPSLLLASSTASVDSLHVGLPLPAAPCIRVSTPCDEISTENLWKKRGFRYYQASLGHRPPTTITHFHCLSLSCFPKELPPFLSCVKTQGEGGLHENKNEVFTGNPASQCLGPQLQTSDKNILPILSLAKALASEEISGSAFSSVRQW